VQEFRAALNGRIEDYVALRIKANQPPITFKLVAVDKVLNAMLEARFDQCLRKWKSEGSSLRNSAEQAPRYAFHGTRDANVEKISNKGLLRVGHELNPNKAIDEGFFGMPHFGVYVSRYVRTACLWPLGPRLLIS
jgi:hypothetical protein